MNISVCITKIEIIIIKKFFLFLSFHTHLYVFIFLLLPSLTHDLSHYLTHSLSLNHFFCLSCWSSPYDHVRKIDRKKSHLYTCLLTRSSFVCVYNVFKVHTCTQTWWRFILSDNFFSSYFHFVSRIYSIRVW